MSLFKFALLSVVGFQVQAQTLSRISSGELVLEEAVGLNCVPIHNEQKGPMGAALPKDVALFSSGEEKLKTDFGSFLCVFNYARQTSQPGCENFVSKSISIKEQSLRSFERFELAERFFKLKISSAQSDVLLLSCNALDGTTDMRELSKVQFTELLKKNRITIKNTNSPAASEKIKFTQPAPSNTPPAGISI